MPLERNVDIPETVEFLYFFKQVSPAYFFNSIKTTSEPHLEHLLTSPFD